jgi:anti-anti-sigma factor
VRDILNPASFEDGTGMETLKIEKEAIADKGIVVLRVHGPLNPTTVGTFSDTVQELLDHKVVKIVLDLVDVDYISSAGISALLNALSQAQQHHGDIVLIHPKPKVLELFGLIDMFHFASDPAAAMALF